MTVGTLLLAGTFLWVVGYFQNRLEAPSSEYFLYTPPWLFILCGAPKLTDKPRNVLSLSGLGFQLSGIFIFIYSAFFWNMVKNSDAGVAIGFIGGIILGLVFARWTYDHKPYE